MEACNQIIGSIIYEPEQMDKLAGWIEPEMFENKVHGEIFKYCLEEYRKGNKYNAFSVQDRFKDNLEAMKEINYSVGNLITMDTKEAAKVLVNEYKARMFNYMATKVSCNAANVDEMMGRFILKLEQLKQDRNFNVMDLAEMDRQFGDKLFCEHEEILLGFDKLDNALGPLERGDVTVIGARPAVGKSAWSFQLGKQLQMQGYNTGFFVYEMSAWQLYQRLMATEAWLPLQRIRRAKNFLGDEETKFNNARKFVRESKLGRMKVIDSAKTTDDIRCIAKQLKLDVLIIDYLQLIKARGTYRGNRVAEVGEISGDLKEIARDLNCHIILLSQLNRNVDEHKRPTLAELRESGSIEQDASNVMVLWNLKTEGEKGVEVLKARQGCLGGCVFKFDGDYMFFQETDKDLTEEEKWETSKKKDNPYLRKGEDNVDKD